MSVSLIICGDALEELRNKGAIVSADPARCQHAFIIYRLSGLERVWLCDDCRTPMERVRCASCSTRYPRDRERQRPPCSCSWRPRA